MLLNTPFSAYVWSKVQIKTTHSLADYIVEFSFTNCELPFIVLMETIKIILIITSNI